MDWGVSPKCPITGTPALNILTTDSLISEPPSTLMAWAPDSFIILMADLKASEELPW